MTSIDRPTIGAGAAYARFRAPGGFLTPAPFIGQVYDVQLAETQWELDFWGRVRSLKDAALQRYLGRRDLDVDWKQVQDAPAEALVTSLSMALPFDAAEKQALLEAVTPADRGAALLAMIEIDTGGAEDDAPRAMH